MNVLDRVRAGCATVAARARHVTIHPEAIEGLAADLDPVEPPLLPEERLAGDDEAVAASVLAWNAVNFGSGWFPDLRKRPGLSGARSLAAAWSDHVARDGAPTAALAGRGRRGPLRPAVRPALPRPGGRPAGAVRPGLARPGGAARRPVRGLGRRPGPLGGRIGRRRWSTSSAPCRWRTTWPAIGGVEVPLYKRAQITASHLARATGGEGLGAFADADRLTAFADNLVPHVLRMAGVLSYDDGLAARIEAGTRLAPGSAEEVEIRACGVHAVELLSGPSGLPPAAIDHQLWQRGQDPAVKAVPRHRCRCSWY